MIISNSGLDKYETCPKMFFYHYIEKIRSNRTTSALLFGSCVDSAIETLLMDKEDPLALELTLHKYKECMLAWKDRTDVDFFKKDFDQVSLKQQDIDYLETLDENSSEYTHAYGWSSLYRKGHHFIDKFYDEFLPRIEEVYSAQQKIEISTENDKIIGYIDFIAKIDGTWTLVDLKTSTKSYSMRTLQESQQLHLYEFAVGLMQKRGLFKDIKLEEIAYCVLRKDSNSKGEMFPIQYISIKPNPEVAQAVMERFDNAIDKIYKKEFPMTTNKNNCKFMFGKPCIYNELCHTDLNLQDLPNLVKHDKK